MDNEFKDLQQKWHKQRSTLEANVGDSNEIIEVIKTKNSKGLLFHYGNILVLGCTLVGLFLFFYFLAPVKDMLSRIGVGFMMIGILLRVVIEVFSSIKSRKINSLDTALQSTELTIAFYEFRKKIHGGITKVIFLLYLVGFYMISPEFSTYFSLWKMILMDVSCLVILVIIYIQIRKGIAKEMKILEEIIGLKKELTKEIS